MTSKSPPVPPLIAHLYPGAHVKAMRNGRFGLLWDPVKAIEPSDRAALRARLIPVATAAFDGTTADYWHEQWSDAGLDRLDVLHVAVDPDGTPVGWVAGTRMSWGGRRSFYAATAGVAPDIQGGGVSAALWRRVVVRELLRAMPFSLYVVLRTGNPLVYDAWTIAVGDRHEVHPREHEPVPSALQELAREAAAYLGQDQDLKPAELIIQDAYRSTPGGLWRDRPRSRYPQTNAWFDTTLAITDAFLVIARFRFLSQFTRSLLPRSFRGGSSHADD